MTFLPTKGCCVMLSFSSRVLHYPRLLRSFSRNPFSRNSIQQTRFFRALSRPLFSGYSEQTRVRNWQGALEDEFSKDKLDLLGGPLHVQRALAIAEKLELEAGERDKVKVEHCKRKNMKTQSSGAENVEYFSLMFGAYMLCLSVSIHPGFFPLFFTCMFVYRRSQRTIRERESACDEAEVIVEKLKLCKEKHAVLLARWAELVEEWPREAEEWFSEKEKLREKTGLLLTGEEMQKLRKEAKELELPALKLEEIEKRPIVPLSEAFDPREASTGTEESNVPKQDWATDEPFRRKKA